MLLLCGRESAQLSARRRCGEGILDSEWPRPFILSNTASCPIRITQPWYLGGHNATPSLRTQKVATHREGGHVPPEWLEGCTDVPSGPGWPEQWDSRFSVDCMAWKSVRGLSLQDGGLESPLFFRDRCSWALVRGTSGTVLNICKKNS